LQRGIPIVATRDATGGPAGVGALGGEPASKGDCKGDCWRRFMTPSFKNRGQCVSSVNGRWKWWRCGPEARRWATT